MKAQTLTREELYKLVWSTPLTTLATQYIISSQAIRKLCDNMQIPLPINGHWEKEKHNKPLEIIQLPKQDKDTDPITLYLREEGEQELKGVPSPLSELQRKIISLEGRNFQVPERLTNPHELVSYTKMVKTKPSQKYSSDSSTVDYDRVLNIKVFFLN
jgi:hypothetical protein